MRSLFETGRRGFRDLAITHALSVGADTLIAIGLAGTLFFAVPSAEARVNVTVYLLLTVAPFAVIGPTLGRLLDRMPASTRTLLVGAAAGRGLIALSLLPLSGTWWLFPGAFGLLVLARVHLITRNALLPLALDEPRRLVDANARIAWFGVLGGAVAGGLGIAIAVISAVEGPLALAGILALTAALVGRRLPAPDGSGIHPLTKGERLPELHIARSVRMARLATAGVRAFNGFLLLLLAFALREIEAGLLDFGALLGAAGIGYAVASRTIPVLSRRVSEEPMVVAALAITAAAAFSAGQWFGLVAAAITAGLAGVAWGTAKLAFDGLLQSQVPAERRGAAFTRSETLFSIAFVAGALIPTAIPLPVTLGLILTGFGALAAQIAYVAALLVPPEFDGVVAHQASAETDAVDDPAACPGPAGGTGGGADRAARDPDGKRDGVDGLGATAPRARDTSPTSGSQPRELP